jgi:type VII secretion-associated serine protease mycosin
VVAAGGTALRPVRAVRAAIRRGPSTRTPPSVLAATVEPGQTVRVAAVRITDAGAVVSVVRSTGPQAVTGVIAAAQADPDVLAVGVDRLVRFGPLDETPAVATAGGVTSTGSPSATPSGSATPSPSPPSPSLPSSPVAATPSTSTTASTTASTTVTVTSDDPDRSQQWGLDALQAERIWPLTRGAGQVVGVIDTGVDASHPDLAGRVLPGTDLVGGAADPGGRAYGHGTHVAGIIAAVAGNRIGVAGLAPAASILPVRALDDDGSGYDSTVAAGITWAVDHGAGVINLSLGDPNPSDLIDAATGYATARGAVVVAAAGNDRQAGNPVEYPAGSGLSGLIAVAATTRANVSAAFSSSGSYVTLAAPGADILSTYPAGRYQSMSGTSMATPFVAASAALLRSVVPGLAPADVVRALVGSADDLEAPGRDDDTGAGLVDPVAALCGLGHCPPGVVDGAPRRFTWVVDPLRLRVAAPGTIATVLAGRRAAISVLVTDSAGPVPGATVRLTAPSGAGVGAAAVGSAVTGADGVARLAAVPLRSGSWTATATAAGRLTGAVLAIPVRVAPAVTVRWTGRRATVTVGPAAGQWVTLWSVTSHGRVRAARARLGSGAAGSVRMTAPSGPVEIAVTAVAGLEPVTVRHG